MGGVGASCQIKFWTLETITFIALVASFISLILNTWERVEIVPKNEAYYSEVENFHKNRSISFENIRGAWINMRVGFVPYIIECQKEHPSLEKLAAYRTRNSIYISKYKK